MQDHDRIRAVAWRQGRLRLLDQRKLPEAVEYIDLDCSRAVGEAITDMVVRGAPAIGIAAAYAVVLAARDRYTEHRADWKSWIEMDLKQLASARPTAVNLHWALSRMRAVISAVQSDPVDTLLNEAQHIHEEDIAGNYRMGELGAALLEGGAALTHCNTGSLATGGYGTALGVIRSAYAAGRLTQVFADETRPWLQGSRLTAWELLEDRIPVTLICEGAAASLLRRGEIGAVIVGADRVAANGDVANKIGTYNLAISARYHGVKFIVVAPISSVDPHTTCGANISIENRAANEIVSSRALIDRGVAAWNPAFDVTPAALIDALVTECGIVHKPDAAGMRTLLKRYP